MFILHLIQAEFGDSLLIQYGSEQSPKYFLIDGGPKHVYNNFLRGELESIVGEGGELEVVAVSHVDNDHIVGILDLLTELKGQEDNNETHFLKIKDFWLNTFAGTIDTTNSLTQRINSIFANAASNSVNMPGTGIAVNGINEGNKVTTLCNILGIPMNEAATQDIFRVGSPNAPMTYGNLTITIVGPTKENLDALKAEWEEWIANQENALGAQNFNVLSMSDKSIPNLSSIAFLIEGSGRSMLFTGDGRGDHLMEGLKKKGMLTNGQMHVEVLKVAHHGSDRNVNRKFFENITADIYVISANGENRNPDYATLSWIIESANDAGRQIEIVITNETPNTTKIQQDYKPAVWGYSMRFIPNGAHSTIV
ncbi:MAG: hypothetical protein ACTHMC_06285 [Pseudobacter sp.]|uniref:hypothetical protein n=1 Tax=Pseudobacter sp. TaxID=2045420 RepID=UPI003F7F072F